SSCPTCPTCRTRPTCPLYLPALRALPALPALPVVQEGMLPVPRAGTVLALAALAAIACNTTQSAAPPALPPTPVAVSPARAPAIDDTTEYIGTLKSLRSTAIQPQIDGQITQILVRSGDRVRQGAPLVQIDPR